MVMENAAKSTESETPLARDGVKTALRTLDVFEAFRVARTPLSLTELARVIGSPVSSCSALIHTLKGEGYLYHPGNGRKLYPTKRLLEQAQEIARHDPLLQRLLPALTDLRDETGETVILGKLQDDAVVYLELLEGLQTVRYTARAGDIKPLHASAIGKALLGTLPEAARERLLARITLSANTPHTITVADALRADLDAGRAAGLFVTRGENVVDVMALATVVAPQGEALGIALAGPLNRMETHFAAYSAALHRCRDILESA